MQLPRGKKLLGCWQVRFEHLPVFKVPSSANLIYLHMIRKGSVHCSASICLPGDLLYSAGRWLATILSSRSRKLANLHIARVFLGIRKCTKIQNTISHLEPVSEVHISIAFKSELTLWRFGDNLFVLELDQEVGRTTRFWKMKNRLIVFWDSGENWKTTEKRPCKLKNDWKTTMQTEKRPSLALRGPNHLGSHAQYTWSPPSLTAGAKTKTWYLLHINYCFIHTAQLPTCFVQAFTDSTGWRCICLTCEHVKTWTQTQSFRATAALAPTSSCVNANRRRVRDKTLK